MTLLYSITIFLGAALLFVVQPMVGKLVLPHVGGGPEVWTTCMLFFQAALLAGYAYAHGLQRVGRAGGQLGIHTVLLAAAVLALPIALPAGWGLPAGAGGAEHSPALAILKVLTVAVACPFAVVATTGPLLQRWFNLAGGGRAADPYFLYAASNAGSMIGLLAYPLVIEPNLTLTAQTSAWAWAYGVYAALVVACGVAMIRGRGEASRAGAAGAGAANAARVERSPWSWRAAGVWLILAMAPSSLCLGATHYLSTDVAAFPFLWVLPLAAYLLTFILAYARRAEGVVIGVGRWVSGAGLVVAALVAAALQLSGERMPVAGTITLHLAVVFFGGLVCHGELARRRPPADRLTGYYLVISVGGAAGGLFNAIIAPLIFTAVWEYPIAIVASILLFAARPMANPAAVRAVRAGVALGAAAVGAALGATILSREYYGEVIHRERTFFGVHAVARNVQGAAAPPIVFHILWHGTTNHGVQQMEPPAARAFPLAYFHRQSPIGSIFAIAQVDEFFQRLAEQRRAFDGAVLSRPRASRVAIIGMGAGSLAAYSRPGDEFTFYEIDPAVDRIARDPRLFAFVPEAKGTIRTVVGDGRVKIAEAPDGAYELIILDAFSSDAIPYHLLTREAVRTYVRKLAPGGIIAVHVSNLYLDLPPVAAAVARDEGLVSILWHYEAPQELYRRWMSSATWVALARSEDDLMALNFGPGTWTPLEARPGERAWTDDYSNLLRAVGPRR